MESFTPEEKYDVIVISEVLYFQTLDEAVRLCERYAAFLNPEGIMVITMAKEAKSAAIFRELARKMKWLNGFIYQAKDEGPDFTVRSERARVQLTGAFTPM